MSRRSPEAIPLQLFAPHVGTLRPELVIDPSVEDAVMFVLDPLEHAGPSPSADDVRRFIARQRSWKGAIGTYDFVRYPQRGIGYDSIVLSEWRTDDRSWREVGDGVTIDAPGAAADEGRRRSAPS